MWRASLALETGNKVHRRIHRLAGVADKWPLFANFVL
jgi:hypothetical protein